MASLAFLEKQVIKNEAKVGLAGTVVGEALRIGQQRLDKLIEVINLLQLAPRVLIELAVAGQNVQFLE